MPGQPIRSRSADEDSGRWAGFPFRDGDNERPSHGAPTFFVRDKKTFVMFHDHHHDDGRLALWVAAAPGAQAEMVDEEPERFFVPLYVGHRGWLGVRLDARPDRDEVTGICEDAYRQVAPKALVTRLDAE